MLALAGVLPARQRQTLFATAALILAIIVGAMLHVVAGIGGHRFDAPISDWATSVVYVLVAAIVTLRAVTVPQGRAAWTFIAVGVTSYGAGNLVWALWLEHVASPPIPSICDALWLALYPTSYVGVALLARRQWRGIPAGVWLDGIVAGLAIAAVGAAVVFGPVLRSAVGSPVAVATNLAYPIADLLLAALVVGVLALRGWRLDRGWAFLGGGFLVLTIADSIYLTQVAGGSAASSNVANLFYMAGVAMLAFGAWQPIERSEVPRTDGLSTLLVPAAFALTAMGCLAYDHFRNLGTLAFILALLSVLAGLLRTALAFRDVSSFNETRRQAITDDLTNLPNRRLFREQLEEAIARSAATGNGVAVLILDLDHFKELNDTLGHHSGDALLRQIGPRLTGVLRPTDMLARLGGDEFGIVLDTPANAKFALGVAERIRAAFAEPFSVQDLFLRTDASVGVALCPEHAATADELLRCADVAMYHAKSGGSGRELYNPDRDLHSRDRLTLAAELDHALQGNEIQLSFQPKADAVTTEIVGLEALARWNHPLHGILLPDLFIPLAETTGLIRALTGHVMELALEQCQAWRANGYDLHVAVNISVADLLDVELPTQVAAALRRHQLPPTALVLEVTESSVFSDPILIRDVLIALDKLGVFLSLDDFGTGFSSLGHLKNLPVGEIKIDRSFVTNMTTNATDAAIVHATIQLGHLLGKRIVAEGVENAETRRQLTAAHCHLIQGFAISKPLSAKNLEALLHNHATRLPTVPARAA